MNKWLPNPRLQKLRFQLLNNPYYRLQSAEEIALAIELGIRIDANQATVDDWLRLPGLSIHQARSLVQMTGIGIKFYCIEDVAAALSIPVPRLEPLKLLINFSYYHDEVSNSTFVINPNTGNLETLLKVPFIDLPLAQAIVENRTSKGMYLNLVDFQQRLNLPSEAITQLMYYLKF